MGSCQGLGEEEGEEEESLGRKEGSREEGEKEGKQEAFSRSGGVQDKETNIRYSLGIKKRE